MSLTPLQPRHQHQQQQHQPPLSSRPSLMAQHPLSLPLHRPPPSAPDARPHTAHATSSTFPAAAAHMAPPLSTLLSTPSPYDAPHFLFADHTAQMQAPTLRSELHLPSLPAWAEDEGPRDPARRISLRPLPTSASSSVAALVGPDPAATRPTLLSRRFSRSYKEGFREGFRDSFKDIRDRIRRTSTPNSADIGMPYSRMHPGGTSLPQPTSPSKRGGRHGDDRPKKHIRNLLQSGDRKDTPAPATMLSIARPASRHLSSVFSVGGGDRARQSAAAWNSSPYLIQDAQWTPNPEDTPRRRSRVGSLSSAADSGADLSSYAGSNKGDDGDVEMRSLEPESQGQDFVKLLPSEIALQIFEYLNPQDLMHAERVSHPWKAVAGSTSVWRKAFLRRFQREIFTDPAPVQVGGAGCGLPRRPDQEWKKMYKARLELEKNWRRGPKDAGKAVYLAGHTDSVYCLQFDEDKIITGSRDRTIRVWDINNFTCKMVIGGPNVKPTPGPKVLRTVDYPDFHIATASVNGTAYGDSIFKVPSQWHDASILCLQYDEKILVTGSSDCDLLVWDINTFEPIHRLRKHSGGVLDVALDAKHIVSCSKDSRIIVWDRETYEPRGELTGHRGPVNAVQLRGKYLASASGDGIARLWDIEQMRLVREFTQKERGLAAVEFSEDMKYVLAGGNDTITYKFEVETGKEVGQFTGHAQLVRSLWLDGANNRVVTGSYDLDLRVYDFETGEQLWRAEEWTTSWMLAAKSDYRRIVATSQDGRLLLIDFGLHKGSDIRDGQPLADMDLLRGTEHSSAIRWRDPWEHDRELQRLGEHMSTRMRQSSVAANGLAPASAAAPALTFW